jgi:hypothetical protein
VHRVTNALLVDVLFEGDGARVLGKLQEAVQELVEYMEALLKADKMTVAL